MSPPIPHWAGFSLCCVLACAFTTGARGAPMAPHDNPQPPRSIQMDSSPGTLIQPTSAGANADSTYLNTQWSGQANADQVNPPDTHGAVGPLGVLHITNRKICYSRKNGLVVWATPDLASFFTSYQGQGVLVDPRAVYDPVLQRFYVT